MKGQRIEIFKNLKNIFLINNAVRNIISCIDSLNETIYYNDTYRFLSLARGFITQLEDDEETMDICQSSSILKIYYHYLCPVWFIKLVLPLLQGYHIQG